MKLRLIDAHCHLNFNAYRQDAEAVIGRSLDQGIGLIAVGTQRDTSLAAAELAAAHDGVWAIVGLHPIHLFGAPVDEEEVAFRARAEAFDPDYYADLAKRFPGQVVGLGECGIDYYHQPDGVDREEFVAKQKEAFKAHLDLALRLVLPLMIHCREAAPDQADGWPSAHDDILEIMEKYAATGRGLAGDIHCFGGTREQAERYINLGMFISFTGTVTFPPRKRDLAAGLVTTQELARRVPIDRLLVETDAPYLAPTPHRGQRNEPAYADLVSAELARIHGVSPEEMAAQTLKNTASLFGLQVG